MSRENLLATARQFLDIDRAAALFYNRMLRVPENHDFAEYLNRREKELLLTVPDYSSRNVVLAVVPGLFYRDAGPFPSDGRQIREAAGAMGLRNTLIQVDPSGSLEKNGQAICSYVNGEKTSAVILFSIGKGSADVKKAIQLCGTDRYFSKVHAWYSVSGILRGSPVVSGIEDSCFYRNESRLYFCWNGYNKEGFSSLRQNSGEEPFSLPAGLFAVSMVPLPLFRQVSERARPYYEYMIQFGPNDGMTLLADAVIPGSTVFALWGKDHYSGMMMEKERMMAALAFFLEKEFPGTTRKEPAPESSLIRDEKKAQNPPP